VADLASSESLGKQLQIYSYLQLNTWILVVPEDVRVDRFVAHGGDLQANNLQRILVVAIPFQPLARKRPLKSMLHHPRSSSERV
jgi:hypothetical protein